MSVYLGLTSAGVGTGAGALGRVSWLRGSSPHLVFEEAVSLVLAEGSAKKRRRAIDLQLSGALARPFVFKAVEGVRSRREAVAIAATLAPEATGLEGTCEVWLDEWAPGRACVAVAVEAELRDRLENVAERSKLGLAALRPWWSLAIDAATASLNKQSLLLAVVDTDALTVVTSTAAHGYSAFATYAPKLELTQGRSVLARAAMAADFQTSDIAWATLSQRDDVTSTEIGATGLSPRLESWT